MIFLNLCLCDDGGMMRMEISQEKDERQVSFFFFFFLQHFFWFHHLRTLFVIPLDSERNRGRMELTCNWRKERERDEVRVGT